MVWFLEKIFIVFKFRFNFGFDVAYFWGERVRGTTKLPPAPLDLQLLVLGVFKTWLSPC